MQKNKIINLIIILVIIFIVMLNFNSKVYADWWDGDGSGPSGPPTVVKENPAIYPDNYKPDDGTSEDQLQTKLERILGTINVVGVVISVITLMIIGIRYMIGSVEEKAEYKKTMIMYLAGAILLAATTTIANILYKLATNI